MVFFHLSQALSQGVLVTATSMEEENLQNSKLIIMNYYWHEI